MNKAEAWLKDPKRTYADGVAIYKSAMGEDKTLAFFNQVRNPAAGALHFNMLIERMRKVARVLAVTEVKELTAITTDEIKPTLIRREATPPKPAKTIHIKAEKASVRIADNPVVDISRLPDNLKPLYQRIKEIPRELATTHAEMKAATTDKARAALLEKCKVLEAEKAGNWKAIDDWWANSGLSLNREAEKAVETADETNTEKRLETLRKAINRAENELTSGKLDAKKKAARKIKIVSWKQEQKDLLKVKKQ